MDQIDYRIEFTDRRRQSAVLQVTDEGQVVVRAPMRMSVTKIEEFVNRHRVWIKDRLSTRTVAKRMKFQSGELVWFEGVQYPLEIRPELGRTLTRIELIKGTMVIKIPLGLYGQKRIIKLKEKLIKWYGRQALQRIEPLVEKYAKLLGKSFGTIRIKNTTTRWGSCSSQGNLNFHWKLVLAPPEILEYVVIHEVCHLVHQHHRTTFWKAVEKFDSHYKHHRLWLKKRGHELVI